MIRTGMGFDRGHKLIFGGVRIESDIGFMDHFGARRGMKVLKKESDLSAEVAL